jgi:hypothetical protein
MQFVNENTNEGSKYKITEIEILEFLEESIFKKKLAGWIKKNLFNTQYEVILEKYINTFIDILLERELIKFSEAKNFVREFDVYGASSNEKHDESNEKNK